MTRVIRWLLLVLALPIVRDAAVCVLCFLAVDRNQKPPDVASILRSERTT